MTANRCLWCEGELAPRRRRGSERRFCTPSCRSKFHSAARRWAEDQVAAGKVGVRRLRKLASKSAHASPSAELGSAATTIAVRRPRPPRVPRPRCGHCGRFSHAAAGGGAP